MNHVTKIDRYAQCVLFNMHAVLLRFVLLWLCYQFLRIQITWLTISHKVYSLATDNKMRVTDWLLIMHALPPNYDIVRIAVNWSDNFISCFVIHLYSYGIISAIHVCLAVTTINHLGLCTDVAGRSNQDTLAPVGKEMFCPNQANAINSQLIKWLKSQYVCGRYANQHVCHYLT